ncbi:acyl-CoA thioesterase [Sheuella amnicola]|nr:acyl-CoA thioesterase [Sheuella amnicola]
MTAAENGPLRVGDTYEIDVPMRWADADALNHLNNAVYFRYMEEGRISMFYTSHAPQSSQFGPVVVHCSCDFKKSIVYPATVRVTHRLIRIGRSSMEHEVDLSVVDGDKAELRAQGRSVMVWMDFKADKSHPWPADVLEALSRVMKR